MLPDTIKYVVPFAIFLLGLCCVPFVEYLKDRRNKKVVLKCFKIELEDEIESLKRSILKASKSLINFNLLKNNEEPNLGVTYFVARKASLLFLENVQNTNYASLSRTQRNLLKVFEVQLFAINKRMENIKKCDYSNEKNDKLIAEYKGYLYTSCCLRSCMKSFLQNIEVGSDEQAITTELVDINCEITYTDVHTIRNVTLDYKNG